MHIRWRCPPLNSCGYLESTSAFNPNLVLGVPQPGPLSRCRGYIVDLERFGKRIDDSHPRIQGSKGVLENNLHRSAEALLGRRH